MHGYNTETIIKLFVCLFVVLSKLIAVDELGIRRPIVGDASKQSKSK